MTQSTTDQSYRFREYSGGCQCGAVRFHATELRDNPHVCYCRMCQKAMGSLYAPLVGVRAEHLTWTRGAPSTFRSSEHVDRGFCSNCGMHPFAEDAAPEGEPSAYINIRCLEDVDPASLQVIDFDGRSM